MPESASKEHDSLEQLTENFEHWLHNCRGMFGDRLRTSQTILDDFVNYCCAEASFTGALGQVTAEHVFAYLNQVSGEPHWRVPYLRNVLRFLFWSGLIPRDLSEAIPVTAQNNSREKTRHLDADTVDKLLDVMRGDSPLEVRDYAMLLMMARLGLRAQEMISLRLDDIDWSGGTIEIRGKGRQWDRMPLPVDVGEALVSWICNARKGDSRHVFVITSAPFRPLVSSWAPQAGGVTMARSGPFSPCLGLPESSCGPSQCLQSADWPVHCTAVRRHTQ